MKPHLTRTLAAVVIAGAASITLPLLADLSLWLSMAALWAVAIGLAAWVAPAWCRHWAQQEVAEPEPFHRGSHFYVDPRHGDDTLDGRTRETAWRTLNHSFAGDGVSVGYTAGPIEFDDCEAHDAGRVNPSHRVRFDPHTSRIIREDTTE